MKSASLLSFLFVLGVSATVHAAPQTLAPAISPPMQKVFQRAKTNRSQIERAWRQTPPNQRAAMQFLLENAPDSDLQTLSATFLRAQVQLAFEARATALWKIKVPDAIFLNDVVPYASLSERRDNSRAGLRKLSLPLIKGIQTPGAAALMINRSLFPLVKVKYSTARQKPDQNPSESMKSGLASCSGLSILVVDACRSVGIPARVVGTPMWANGRGNHTWVEVWDGGWHFLGAAEGDDLDKGWFTGDAAQANTGSAENAIYASSWAKKGTYFPLVWNRRDKSVAAQIVTPRYAPTRTAIADTSKTRILISVIDATGKRIALPVSALDSAQKVLGAGTSRGETADTNDFFSVDAPRGSVINLSVESDGKTTLLPIRVGNTKEQRITIRVQAPGVPPRLFVPTPTAWAPEVKALSPAFQAEVEAAATRFFAPPSPLGIINRRSDPALDRALLENEPAVRAAVWKAFKASQQPALKADFDQNVARNGDYVAPFAIRTVGKKPKNGWGLVIAMHGGGGTAKEVNDSQWEGMKTHYRDHGELGGYKYLTLRAPNDLWNGFYDDYVYPLIENLIRAQTSFGEVDPNRVYLTGYSHGGYGAYAIGPKIPDRFAFIHASAGAATDGETSAKTLRNTPFTAMVGERDLAYDRLSRNQKFDALLQQLRGESSEFPARIDVMNGFEHGNLPDRDELVEMLPARRNPVPRHLTWEQTDGVVKNFFWLESNAPAKGQEIDASIENNVLSVITTGEIKNASVWLDSRLIDFSQPLQLNVNGKLSTLTLKPSFTTLCATMERRGDPDLASTARVNLGE